MTTHQDSSETLFASLDIGSKKITCAIIRSDMNKCKILGLSCVAISKEESRLDEMSIAINASIKKAELAADVTINTVNLGVSCEYVTAIQGKGNIGLSGPVNHDDIKKVINVSTSNFKNRDIIHVLPQSFYINNQMCPRPIGEIGHTLTTHVNMIELNSHTIVPLINMVNNTGYSISNIILKSLGSAQILLNQEIKEKGCLLLDIGENTTEYLVFLDGYVTSLGELPIGGSYITKDLAYGLQQSWSIAENIKCLYGSAVANLVSHEEKIKITSSEFSESWELKKNIAEIIQPRLEEILFLADEILEHRNIKSYIKGGVILSGGVSHTKDIDILAKEIFQLPVHIASIELETALKQDTQIQNYVTVIGIAAYAAKYESCQRVDMDSIIPDKKIHTPNKFQTWLGEFF